jgi:hypothetical protein
VSLDSSTAVGRISPEIDLNRLLWLAVFGAAAADVVLTVFGLSLCFSEQNPVARSALDFAGPMGLVALKGATIAVLAGTVRVLAPRHRPYALALFCLPQFLAAAHNGLLLALYAHTCP